MFVCFKCCFMKLCTHMRFPWHYNQPEMKLKHFFLFVFTVGFRVLIVIKVVCMPIFFFFLINKAAEFVCLFERQSQALLVRIEKNILCWIVHLSRKAVGYITSCYDHKALRNRFNHGELLVTNNYDLRCHITVRNISILRTDKWDYVINQWCQEMYISMEIRVLSIW